MKVTIFVLILLTLFFWGGCKKDTFPGSTEGGHVETKIENKEVAMKKDLVPIKINYPPPAISNDPDYDLTYDYYSKFDLAEKQPLVLAPANIRNVALGKPVSCSKNMIIVGEYENVTDGDKRAKYFLEFEPKIFPAHITIDLKRKYEIYAVVWWHSYWRANIYRDVIVQISEDKDFENSLIIFNNDRDGSIGLGKGSDLNYIETHKGWIAASKGTIAQYVRLYSCENAFNQLVQYTEVEVYGVPCDDVIP